MRIGWRAWWSAFALGVGALQCQSVLPGAWRLAALWCVCALAGALAWRLRRAAPNAWRGVAGICMWCAAAALCGFGYAAVRDQARMSEALPVALEGHEIGVTGTVRGIPALSARSASFLFEVERTDADLAHFPSLLQLNWFALRGAAGRAPLQPGDRWHLRVKLKRMHGTENFALRDEEAAWLARGIRAHGAVSSPQRAQRLAAAPKGLRIWFEQTRAALVARIGEVLGAAPQAGIVAALAVGAQDAIDDADWQVLRSTGTNHLVAVSGLHIGLAAGLCGWLAGFVWRQSVWFGRAWPLRWPAPKIAIAGGLAGAAAYAALAGFNVPAQRAWWMLAAAGAAYLCGRRWPPSALFAGALGCVLLADPWAVLAPGFWLSFAAVAAILLAASGRADGSAMPERRAYAARLASRLLAAGRAQYAVTSVLVPLTLFWFAQLAWLAPVANAVAIPWVSLWVTPCALAGVVLPQPLDAWAWHGAQTGAAWLMRALQALAAVRHAQVWLPAPGVGALLAASVGALWLLLPRGWPLRWAAPLTWLPLALPAVAPHGPAPGEARLTALDVGQGPAVLIETAHHRMLFGAGTGPAGERLVVPFLHAQGVTRLDMAVAAYADTGRITSLQAVLTALEVGRVLAAWPPAHRGWRALHGAAAQTCAAGRQWRWDGVTFEVLWPAQPGGQGIRPSEPRMQPGGRDIQPSVRDAQRRPPDAQSCVLRVVTPGATALLTGDLDARAEQALRTNIGASAAAADILLMPRQGSRRASTEALLDSVAPHLAIFQVAYRNRFGHPHPSVWARAAARGIALARTDTDGAVRVTLPAKPGAAPVPESWRAAHRRYWTD